jgi:hypothetical protein
MTAKRPRGRPAGPSTLERRRVKELLRLPPAHVPRMTDAERAELEKQLAAGEHVRKQILKDYKYGATTPDAHAYEMASLGDESMEGHEGKVLARDRTYKRIADEARGKGSQENRRTADRKAASVCEHFRDLLSQAVPLGRLSRSGVAKKMQERWPSDGRLGALPSEKTLRNWIERGSPFPAQRVGKVSLDKK